MSGRENGCQKHLTGLLDHYVMSIIFMAHDANLVVEHSNKASVLVSKMYNVLQAIYGFFVRVQNAMPYQKRFKMMIWATH